MSLNLSLLIRGSIFAAGAIGGSWILVTCIQNDHAAGIGLGAIIVLLALILGFYSIWMEYDYLDRHPFAERA